MMARLLLTSIPKSGTHILALFFEKYGIRRHRVDDHHYQNLCVIDQTYRVDDPFIEKYGQFIPLFQELEIRNKKDYGQRFAHYREKTISEIASAPDHTYICNHYPHDPVLMDSLAKHAIPVIFLVRDPRDNMVSLKNHIMRHPEHHYHSHLVSLSSNEERLLALIHGISENDAMYRITPLALHYQRFFGWLQDARVFGIRFEEIVGPRGGGSRFLQYKAFEKIMMHAGQKPDGERFYRCVSESFSPTHSLFFKGQIGQWKEEFTPAVHESFSRKARHLLSDFGYSEAGLDAGECLNPDEPSDVQRLVRCYRDAESENSRLRELANQLKQKCRDFTIRYEELGKDGAKRLELIQKQRAEILRCKELSLHIQEDSSKRLEFIKKLTQQLDGQKSALDQLKESLRSGQKGKRAKR